MTRKCQRCGASEQMFYSVDYCRPCVEKAGVEARREERARLASAKQLARYRKAAKAAALAKEGGHKETEGVLRTHGATE